MKVLLDYRGLLIVAKEEIGASRVHLISDLLVKEALHIWISTDNLTKVVNFLKVHHGTNTALDFADRFLRRCTTIPVRQAMIFDALKEEYGDLDANINIRIAQMFHIDCILTPLPERYSHTKIPVTDLNDCCVLADDCQVNSVEKVPFLDLKAQHSRIYTEIDARITKIIAGTGFILGPQVNEFEQRFAELQEVKFCLGVSSGTAALHISLMALNIGFNDHVLLPVNTFIATAEAVSLAGATPVFVDCDEYYQIDPEQLEKNIKNVIVEHKRPPKALIVVHLYGHPANMTRIMALAIEYGIEVIEDACQAHLARFDGKAVGQFGRFGAFSFYPGKNLGAYGEAGALITQDEKLYIKAKMLRQHGEIKRYQHELVGHNYRMSAIQGAVLSTKLQYLPQWTIKRQAVAQRYNEILSEIENLLLPAEYAGAESVYHLFVIQTDYRDELRQYLSKCGIDTGIHYPLALHQQTAYKYLGYKENDFPMARTAVEKILSLPMYPELSEQQILYVCNKIKSFYKEWNQ